MLMQNSKLELSFSATVLFTSILLFFPLCFHLASINASHSGPKKNTNSNSYFVSFSPNREICQCNLFYLFPFCRWAESLRKPSPSLPCHTLQSSEFILQPHSHNGSWLSIDGEPYEAMPVAVKMRPSTLKMFCSKTHA